MYIIHLSTKHYMNTNNIFKVKVCQQKTSVKWLAQVLIKVSNVNWRLVQ